jgi:hypothetical protein
MSGNCKRSPIGRGSLGAETRASTRLSIRSLRHRISGEMHADQLTTKEGRRR